MKLTISKESLVKDSSKGILYLLELHLEDKVLVKVGITHRKIEDRVLEILLAIHTKYRYYPHCKQLRFRTVEDPLAKEQLLHKYLDEYSYTTEHKWAGSTEVFLVDVTVAKEAYDKLLDGTLYEGNDRYADDMGLEDKIPS